MRVATSKPVQRAAINTALLASGAISLFCLAAIATGLFFQNFVPDHLVTIPVHLQYGSGPHPYGLSSLTRPPMMKTQQEYDVSVVISMPRSPANVERGNFMVALHLLASEASAELEADAHVFANVHDQFGAHQVVFSSRRPALVPYMDPMVSVAKRLVLLLYHLLFPSSQVCKMTVILAERLAFPKASLLPASAYVEIEAGQDIQIYGAALTMTAQLRGLRWLMFYYRLPTYMAFTVVFWACEVMFMGLAWAVWIAATGVRGATDPRARKGRRALGGNQVDDEGSKNESSDHPYSFPTYGKQPPLKHEPEVKAEHEEERGRQLVDIPAAGAEADDEDELHDDDDDGSYKWRYDSGLGTSYSERGSDSTRRRPSRNMSGHEEGAQRR
ncbi:tubulin-tyrosine ligase [Ophiocordyceps sinensis CO18]|nr:tubulin-tyrosine ligase [Ophiocordyceps sinensis CO18]